MNDPDPFLDEDELERGKALARAEREALLEEDPATE